MRTKANLGIIFKFDAALQGSAMICTYILKCYDETYYVGSTNDMERRLEQHQTGQSKSTKNRRPIKLVFTKEFSALKEARSYEHFIKRQRNKVFYEKLIDGAIV